VSLTNNQKERTKENWTSYVDEAYKGMLKENDTRELGKFLAQANEYFQRDWINFNTSLHVTAETLGNDNDKNRSGYDLLSLNKLRIQSKFRSSTLHLECTRRISKKNTGSASASGHVAYGVDEADVFVFTRPHGNYEDPENAEILAIPAKALEDPKHPGFLKRSVPKKVYKDYIGKAKEVLEELEREKQNERK